MGTRTRLVLASSLMLFLELALIRWTGANVLHLGFFSNFVLLGSFLGIGLGFLRTRPNRRARPYYSPVALLALVGFISAHPVVVDRESTELIFFTSIETQGPPVWISLPVIFLAVAVIMAGPGELVAECFHELPRLEAYRLDLIGSLTGIASFTALSFAGAPSVVWGLVVGGLFLVLLGPPAYGLATAAIVGLGALLWGESALVDDGEHVSWSPYYKVTTFDTPYDGSPNAFRVEVNGIQHQRVTTAALREQEEPQYVIPYQRIPDAPRNVLVVGAGTGTDVAIALGQGAQHVDAVEIDPRLADLGREKNPDRPYDDPRVTVHVDDGRAFLERTDAKYDLILFALPDSLTLVSGASSLRLESYLFTEQALEAARARLAPGGAFSMYNFYRELWLVDRLAGTLETVFGHAPCVDANPALGRQAIMVVGLGAADQRCEQTWARSADTPAPSTDDRPFLYLRGDSLRGLEFYATAILLIIAASILAVRSVAGVSLVRMAPYRDLFLLGAAFLLLETKSVTGFALLFGTTWVVNALVFAGVLIAVLAAVEVTRRLPTPPLPVMYGVLIGGLALAWLVPSSWLLSLPVPARAGLAITVAFLPIFAANVIFAKRFAETPEPTIAFGANLLGAMVGGCLEYAALVVGYNALLIVAGALYVGAYVLRPVSTQHAPQLAVAVAHSGGQQPG